jgi:hypothetical protein
MSMLIRRSLTMSALPIDAPGAPSRGSLSPRPLAPLQLIAILALAVSTLVAATAVSIGLARAGVPSCVTANISSVDSRR